MHTYKATLVIPRQQPKISVAAPFQATHRSYPGGSIQGQNQFLTILRFVPTVSGQLIKTEGFGTGKAGRWWNNNNTAGDATRLSTLCASAHDFTVDGMAGFGNYPYSKAGPHGRDLPQRADGLCIQASGFVGENLRFFQVPGTAIILMRGGGTQSGALGIYDGDPTRLNQIWISQCLNGIDDQVGDSRLTHVYIFSVAKDGLTVSGPGTYVFDSHIWGADRACVVTVQAEFHAAYHEAARVGTVVMGKARGTTFHGLNIGPATCWERGVELRCSGVNIVDLKGTVRTGAIGLETISNSSHETIQGEIYMRPKSTGVLWRSSRSDLSLKGNLDASDETFVKVAEPITSTNIDIAGWGNVGTVLDLSASGSIAQRHGQQVRDSLERQGDQGDLSGRGNEIQPGAGHDNQS